MKLTRRQLNRIITESLGLTPVNEIKGIPKILNYGKMRKDLFALQKDIDNQDLLDKVQDHIDDLKTKVDAGESKFLKGRYREAVTLLQAMEAVMDNPTPAAAKKAVEKVPDEQPAKKEPESKPDPQKWNPDPDPGVGWEYQNRDCVWFTRKKGTTKEYKLGHASGKPLVKGGKFLKSIVKLNKTYPDLVKGCNATVDPPQSKPKSGGGGKYNKLSNLYSEVKGINFGEERQTSDMDRSLSQDLQTALYSMQAAESMINKGKSPRTTYLTTALPSLKRIFDVAQKVKGGISSTDRLVQTYMIFDSENKQIAAQSVGYVYSELDEIAKEYSKDKNESIKNLGINIRNTLNSSDYKLEGGQAAVVKGDAPKASTKASTKTTSTTSGKPNKKMSANPSKSEIQKYVKAYNDITKFYKQEKEKTKSMSNRDRLTARSDLASKEREEINKIGFAQVNRDGSLVFNKEDGQRIVLTPSGERKMEESLSRGSLYRKHYYGRY